MANGEDPVFVAAVDRVTATRPHGVTVHEALLRLFDETDRVANVTNARLDQDGDTIHSSLRTVLRRLDEAPTRDELGELVRRLSGEGVIQLTTLQEFWIARIQRGDPI